MPWLVLIVIFFDSAAKHSQPRSLGAKTNGTEKEKKKKKKGKEKRNKK